MAGLNSPDQFIALVHPGGTRAEGAFVDDDSPLPVSIVSLGLSTLIRVEGRAADGTPAVGNPVLIGGLDGSNNVQSIFVGSSGRLLISGGLSDGVANAQFPVVIGMEDNNGLARVALAASADARPSFRVLGTGLLGYNGTNHDILRVPTIFKTVSLSAATAETTIWTPATSKKFRLMGFILTVGAASTLTFKDNTAGTTIFIARGTTDQPIVVPYMGNGILSAAANNVLTVTRGTSATLDGVVWGTEE